METSKHARQNPGFVIITCLLSLLLMTHAAWSADSRKAEIIVDTESGRPINLAVNKLAKLKAPSVVARAHIVNPEIAELIYSNTQSPLWVFVSGKKAGSTQLTLWGTRNELLGTFEVVVSPDVAGLKKTLYEIFPHEDVSVASSGDHIVLNGTVSGAMKMKEILTLAESFSSDKDKAKVINLLQVGGIQQVMLEVRIAEISKNTGEELGINFAWNGNSGFGLSMLDSMTAIPAEGWPGNPLNVASSVNAVLGFTRGDPVIVAIDALQEDGLLQILAKPTLIAQSGQSASFLAGGEFPFPVAEDYQNFSIEWKPFGVGLNFTPTVIGDNTISLVVAPEVSELDFTKTISYAGYVVPSIDTRRMSTVVELKDNQSFAIAGLLKNNVRESVKKFPVLGDLPIIGALFRSTRFQKEETELVVIVTPHLVKPVNADELPLPTDSFQEPSPFELLLLGRLEKIQDPATAGDNQAQGAGTVPAIEGDFGYITPE
jgi:pilus assembly protein CpaC